MIRQPGLFNRALVIGLLAGPALGAAVESALAVAAHGAWERFVPILLNYLRSGYLMLPLLALAMLALRYFRRDSMLACAIVGAAIGVAFFFVTAAGSPSIAQFVFQGALPFALMLLAVRLIAGRRLNLVAISVRRGELAATQRLRSERRRP